MAKIIGLTGYQGLVAGVGKDTAANWLKEYFRAQFRSVAFADPIREAMKVIFGWDDSYFTHPKKNQVDPRFNISPRKAMQTLGTEWGRKMVDDKLWLTIAGNTAAPLLGAGFDVLLTDTRFPNEGEWIRDNGGEVWHIDATQRGVQSGAGTEVKHSSEVGIPFVKGDVLINNNETLGYFFDQLAKLAQRLQRETFDKEQADAVVRLKPFMVVPGDADVIVTPAVAKTEEVVA